MLNKSRIFVYLFLMQFLVSCSLIGINIRYKTPKRPAHYPAFKEKDYLKGSITPYRKNYDVHYYNISVDVDIEHKFLKGSVDICFKPLIDLDTIQIDLFSNMKINHIYYGKTELKYNRKYNAVFVHFPEKITTDSMIKITVSYEGKPVIAPKPPWEGGFVWKKDKDKNPWIGVACELTGASLWWPLKDLLSDEPDSMTMNATIPDSLYCVSNGKLFGIKKNDHRATYTWKTKYPINTYDITIYIGNYRNFTIPFQSAVDSFDMDFYVLPYDLPRAKVHFEQAVDIIKFYESAFGPYPWAKENYKLVEGPYAGQENQTAIAYGYNFKNDYRCDCDYIILHETAHEWWGNSVSATDYAEIWLQEGFATYSEALYVEHTKGYDAYLQYLLVYSLMIKNKRPVIGPYGVSYWNYKDGDVYMKGALTLHTLRNLMNNDDLFFTLIKTFYNEHKYSSATTKDFIKTVNKMTGQDYTWFFDQYLYSRVCPRLEWNVVTDEKTHSSVLYFKWANTGSDFKLPVLLKNGRQFMTIHPSDKLQSVNLDYNLGILMNPKYSYYAVRKNKHLGHRK